MIETRPLSGPPLRPTASQTQADLIACPNCGTELEIADMLARRIRAQMRAELEGDARALAREKAAFEADRRAKEAAAEAALEERVRARLGAEREAARAEARDGVALETAALQERLAEVETKLRTERKEQLAVLAAKRRLEREKEEVELRVARRMDEELGRARAEAKAQEAEQRALDKKQHEEQLEGLRRTIEDLKGKADQGSQQLQGESLEVGLEERLQAAFPADDFAPVPKGIRGADLVQSVRTTGGEVCGTLLWEAKRTKHWDKAWLPKLRDDQRALKAEIAVLVSAALPKDAAPISCIDEVWVTSYACVAGLAQALRSGLVEAARSKQALVGRREKMKILYGYLSGPEFRNRVQGLLEPFLAMREDLEREKRSVQRLWAKREKQIERALGSTSGLYGDLQGIVGAGLPELDALDLPALDDGDATPSPEPS